MLKLILCIFGCIILITAILYQVIQDTVNLHDAIPFTPAVVQPSVTPTPTLILLDPPDEKVLDRGLHVFQTFNNCGPAALSMALSYYGMEVSQQELGQQLRPYQNPHGDNDDKSVTLEELAEKSKEFGFIPYHRPNGTIELLQNFISNDMPVITRTLLKPNDDIGHYRVVKGYVQMTQQLLQDDSLQGKNLWYSYDDFNILWEKFNYEYLVLVPVDKKLIAETILGEDVDSKTAWQKAVDRSIFILAQNPEDIYVRFNLSVAFHNIGKYKKAVDEFEKIEYKLPFRTLWYQIEPIEAYFALGDYDRVLEITDRVLRQYNRAFSELYLLRGEIYKKEGEFDKAREEFEKAVFYNKYLEKAKEALNNI